MVESKIKDLIISSDQTEVVREKLEGHKASVNSLDYYKPLKEAQGYLNSAYQQESGLLLSASDDGTSLIWDLRINKRALLI